MPSSKNMENEKRSQLLYSLAKQVQIMVFDFDGVFTDNRVLVFQDGKEGVFCSRADGLGMEAVRKLGINLMVISKEKNPVVNARCKKLSLPCIQDCDNKAEVLAQEVTKLGIPLKNVAYMGNDINDLECLKLVGLPACVADSHPDILDVALYVSKTKGGYGAVREFCDCIVGIRTGEGLTNQVWGGHEGSRR